MTATASILIDVLAIFGVGQQEAVGVFHKCPLIYAITQHSQITALAQRLGGVAAVVNHYAVVWVALECPLVFV